MATRMMVKRTFLDFAETIDEDHEEVGYMLRRSRSDPALCCWRKEDELSKDELQQSDAEAETVASRGVEGGWSTDVESSDGDCGDAGTSCTTWPAGVASPCSVASGHCLNSSACVTSPQGAPWGVVFIDSGCSWGPWLWDECGAPEPGPQPRLPAQDQPQRQAPKQRSRCRLSANSRMASSQLCGQAESPSKGAAFSRVVRSVASGNRAPQEHWTTVMMRNMPNNYTRDMLLRLMDLHGFAGAYDFVYLPVDFSTQSNLGYAFVNLTDATSARCFWQVFEGFSEWEIPSRKVCILTWSDPLQGLDANIERYRSSPVMCETVPDEFKPAVFSQGVRVHFPPPLKKLRAPRRRKGPAHLPHHLQESGMDLAGDFGREPEPTTLEPDAVAEILCMIPVNSHECKGLDDISCNLSKFVD